MHHLIVMLTAASMALNSMFQCNEFPCMKPMVLFFDCMIELPWWCHMMQNTFTLNYYFDAVYCAPSLHQPHRNTKNEHKGKRAKKIKMGRISKKGEKSWKINMGIGNCLMGKNQENINNNNISQIFKR